MTIALPNDGAYPTSVNDEDAIRKAMKRRMGSNERQQVRVNNDGIKSQLLYIILLYTTIN